MAKITDYMQNAWQGSVPPMSNTVEVRDRAGTDGYTFVRQGKRSPQFSLMTKSNHLSLRHAQRRAQDYESLIGRFITLEDPASRGYSKIMVLSVTTTVRRLLASTDGSEAQVEAQWTLQRGR